VSALWGLAVNGAIPVGSGPAVAFKAGCQFNATGQLIAGNTPPLFNVNNVPHDGAQRMSYSEGATIDHWNQGLPYTDDGKLCVTFGDPVDHWSNGIPFSDVGRVVLV
jgi:hypothetical protein